MSQSTIAPPLSTYQPQINTGYAYNAWLTFNLGGIDSPGTITRNGIKGFQRETEWDSKAGKGNAGSVLTLTGLPPCKGSIEIQLLTSQDLADWDSFVSAVLSTPTADQQKRGLTFFHPSFTSIGLTAVVVASYSRPVYDRGRLLAEIHFIEWRPPPNVNLVTTPSSLATDQNNGVNQPAAVDPRLVAKAAELQAVSTNAANTLGRAAGSQ
jgi:hypothetical protein